MQESITLQPISSVDGIVQLPGSKSISNRALLLASMAHGTTRLINLLDSNDVKYMLSALSALKIDYSLSSNRTICEIVGNGSPLKVKDNLTLFLGNSGISIRSLTAVLCLTDNCIVLTGEPRMKERPIGPLVKALRQGGAHIDYLEQTNYPPLRIHGGFIGGKINISNNVSSQFLSALLIAAPMAKYDTTIFVEGEIVSKPYIDITLNVMKQFGVVVENHNYQYFYVHGQQNYISPGYYLIEGDASSASYFLAAAAIKGGTVRVTGVDRSSIQGDIFFANVLEQMGAEIEWGDNYIACTHACLYGIDIDANHIPDAAMTIAITALFANGSTTLRNIFSWRIKETDRLTAMATELRKIGAKVKEGHNFIHISPPKYMHSADIVTYNDHRIAMCFSLVALSNIAITILNPKCIEKTFPNYFSYLFKLSNIS